MNNAERLMRDVANVVYLYESDNKTADESVKKLFELFYCQPGCKFCAYNTNDEALRPCEFDDNITCSKGFEFWLKREAL